MRHTAFPYIYVLLALLPTISCSSADGPGENSGETQPIQVTLRIGTPAQNEVTYGGTRTQDIDEYEVKTLTLLDFPVNTDGSFLPLDAVYHLTVAESGNEATPGSFISSGNVLTARVYTGSDPALRHVFAVVANEQPEYLDSRLTQGVTTIRDLCLLPSQKTIEEDTQGTMLAENGFTMAGMSGILSIEGQQTTVSMQLERAAARLDVKNNLDSSLTSEITLLDVHVRNAAGSGCLRGKYPDGLLTAKDYDPGKPVTARMTAKGETELPLLARGSTCSKALYLYEKTATQGGSAPVIVLTYRLNGEVATTEVSPQPTAEEGDPESFYFQRNRLYTLVVGGESPQGAPVSCRIIQSR